MLASQSWGLIITVMVSPALMGVSSPIVTWNSNGPVKFTLVLTGVGAGRPKNRVMENFIECLLAWNKVVVKASVVRDVAFQQRFPNH
jgi:hypothetical protein